MSLLPLLFFSCGRIGSMCLNTVFVALLILDFYIAHDCQLITDGTLDAIMGTNRHEAASMLGTVPWSAYIAAVLALGLVAVLSWRLGRWNRRAVMIAMVPLVLTGGYNSWKLYANWPFHTAKWTDIVYRRYIASDLRDHAPGVVGDVTYLAIISTKWVKDRRFVVRAHTVTDRQVIGRHAGRVRNIVFIMGESSLASRYGVYGYDNQNTTPNLQEMKDRKQICVLAKVHTNAPMTRYSVPMSFSFQTPEIRETLFNEKNIIEMARDNGYKTFWIASQDGKGPYARPFGYLSEYSDYTTRQDYNNETNGVNWKDESIMPVLADKMHDPAPYKMYVVHIMGSHRKYDDKVTPRDVQALPDADTYDQSIHHTDSIVQQIMSIATSELGDYTMIYTSDHGEIVNVGHGYQYGGYDQYIIPMIIHDANGVGTYCNMAEQMRNHDGYYTSIMNKYLLLDMLGYDVDPAAMDAARSRDHVLHADSKVYNYNNLPTEKNLW
ncbi:phosphoethanolamine transferase [Komagataeibacter diospyri]|uniref:phosphoethanolamine transferase n=1 Tax=Komagataeibacter diospyri TaxID=1932662 RepID=UPI00113E4D5C|nr:phosphoethanolamine transferase [Komagataeibacter diospyri]GCE88800.1 hypothetical protein MSKU15_0401 [Komagataeibacter diospyri]